MSLRDFWAAVESFAVVDTPLTVAPDAEERVRVAAAAGGPVLLGEMHGAVENPLLALALMRRFDLRTLALEWEPSGRPALDRYLAGGRHDEWPPLFTTSCDGRITAGHLAVLHRLHQEGWLERLVLFNAPMPTRGDWSGRDRAMAERLLAGIVGGPPALVVAGNLHTHLEPHRHGVPVGWHVARAMPGVVEILIDYCQGEIHNMGPRRVGGLSLLRRPPTEPTLRLAGARLVLTVPKAHPAVVPDPDCRSSGR